MKFRHEFKHEINYCDHIMLRSRLQSVMRPDENAIDGKYDIRSLYFDNVFDTVLLEKINGVNNREKFRIRCYNNNKNFIRLEKKSKVNGLCNKVSAVITEEEVRWIINGEYAFLEHSDRPLLRELFYKMKTKGLEPKTIVDYTREAFVLEAGNVRVTLDYDIRTGLHSKDFLNEDCVTIPAGDNVAILEVKWDEYLPDIVRDIVNLQGRRSSAFSKYAASRIYG